MLNWKLCKDELPATDDVEYLVNIGDHYGLLQYCDGWNCMKSMDGEIIRDYEVKDVFAWCKLTLPEGEKE